MSDVTSYPETYIQDYDKAIEVAYAGKELRCLAAAGRMVDVVMQNHALPESVDITKDTEQRKVVSTFDEFDFEERTQITNELFIISTVYPDAFAHIRNKPDKATSRNDIFEKLALIVGTGGLPITHNEMGDFVKKSVDELDAAAETRETIAAVLYDNPPSADFIESSDYLKNPFFGKLVRVDVETVLGLIKSAKHYSNSVEQWSDKTRRQSAELRTGYANKDRLSVLLSMLHEVELEISMNLKDASFREEVKRLLNSVETSFKDIEQLWLEGASKIARIYADRCMGNITTYDLIMSGEAARYVSPISAEE